ncbi:MAG: NAD(+) diphosphatase [Longimicrobiales bacterium]
MKACIFYGNEIVLVDGGLPAAGIARGWAGPKEDWFEFDVGGATALAGEMERGGQPPPGSTPVSMRAALSVLGEVELPLALKAAHLSRWRRTSRHCGACGSPTAIAEGGKAFRCTDCGHRMFPKVSPAIIVQVYRNREILLGRSMRHPKGFYSVLAGFVDPGENLEEAVHREVFEESGVSLKNVSYFGSQPWPFPDSLMVGFTAEYAGGDIRNDDDEMEDVQWFPVDALPPVPPPYSIARTLIDDFAERNGVSPADVPTWGRESHRRG